MDRRRRPVCRDRLAGPYPAARRCSRGLEGFAALAASIRDRGPHERSGAAAEIDSAGDRRQLRDRQRAVDRRHRQGGHRRCGCGRARWPHHRRWSARLDADPGGHAHARRKRRDHCSGPVGHARACRADRMAAGLSGRRRHDDSRYGRRAAVPDGDARHGCERQRPGPARAARRAGRRRRARCIRRHRGFDTGTRPRGRRSIQGGRLRPDEALLAAAAGRRGGDQRARARSGDVGDRTCANRARPDQGGRGRHGSRGALA